jgi:colicin import membrane protein
MRKFMKPTAKSIELAKKKEKEAAEKKAAAEAAVAAAAAEKAAKLAARTALQEEERLRQERKKAAEKQRIKDKEDAIQAIFDKEAERIIAARAAELEEVRKEIRKEQLAWAERVVKEHKEREENAALEAQEVEAQSGQTPKNQKAEPMSVDEEEDATAKAELSKAPAGRSSSSSSSSSNSGGATLGKGPEEMDKEAEFDLGGNEDNLVDSDDESPGAAEEEGPALEVKGSGVEELNGFYSQRVRRR